MGNWIPSERRGVSIGVLQKMILSLKFDVLNNVKTEMVNGQRGSRMPSSA